MKPMSASIWTEYTILNCPEVSKGIVVSMSGIHRMVIYCELDSAVLLMILFLGLNLVFCKSIGSLRLSSIQIFKLSAKKINIFDELW